MRTLLLALPLLCLMACVDSPKEERAEGKTPPADAILVDSAVRDTPDTDLRSEPLGGDTVTTVPVDPMEEDRD